MARANKWASQFFLGASTVTNILIRVRAVGISSLPWPFQVLCVSDVHFPPIQIAVNTARFCSPRFPSHFTPSLPRLPPLTALTITGSISYHTMPRLYAPVPQSQPLSRLPAAMDRRYVVFTVMLLSGAAFAATPLNTPPTITTTTATTSNATSPTPKRMIDIPVPGVHGAECRRRPASSAAACDTGLACVYTLIGDEVVRSSCQHLAGPGEACTHGSQAHPSGLACYPGLRCVYTGRRLGAAGVCSDRPATAATASSAGDRRGEQGQPCNRRGNVCGDGLTCVTKTVDGGAAESICLNMAGPGEACTAEMDGPASGILCFPDLTCTPHDGGHGEAGVCTDRQQAQQQQGPRRMLPVVVARDAAASSSVKRLRRADRVRRTPALHHS